MIRLGVRDSHRRRLFEYFTKSRAWSNTTNTTTENAQQIVNKKCKLTDNLTRTGTVRFSLPCSSFRQIQCTDYHSSATFSKLDKEWQRKSNVDQQIPALLGANSVALFGNRAHSTVPKHSTSNVSIQRKNMVEVSGMSLSVRQFSTGVGSNNFCNTSNGNDSNNNEEDIETPQQEWVHPSSRQESILDKDPGLRSLLSDLASDFGKSDDVHSETKPRAASDNTDTYGVNLDYHDDIRIVHVDDGQDSEGARRAEQTGNKKDAPDKKSVFSISDVVEILREENAKDICVIKVSKNRGYVDYFTVVTGRSNRHLRAMVTNLNKRYKEAKHTKDPFMKIEGKVADDWMCIDFGNIVVHFMMEETRELYDLEMLWTLGPEYDEQFHRISQYQANVIQPVELTQEELLEYQANVIQPVELTQEELLEYEGGIDGSHQEMEGYTVIIETEEDGADDIPNDKRI